MSLEDLLKKQKRFHDKVVLDNEKFPREKGPAIFMLTTALIHEAIELQRLTNWKWWKRETHLDEEDAKEELVDIFHFFMDLVVTMGMDAEELEKEYERKLKINYERLANGY